MKVIVAGAGLAGLTAATALLARGVDVVVLEARERVGGRTHGIEVAPGGSSRRRAYLGAGAGLHALAGLRCAPRRRR
jgi:monoamine oxidase